MGLGTPYNFRVSIGFTQSLHVDTDVAHFYTPYPPSAGPLAIQHEWFPSRYVLHIYLSIYYIT
jgi:hypothetical protein